MYYNTILNQQDKTELIKALTTHEGNFLISTLIAGEEQRVIFYPVGLDNLLSEGAIDKAVYLLLKDQDAK